jgi:hypothetical protein
MLPFYSSSSFASRLLPRLNTLLSSFPMAECPWCHGAMRDADAPCPKCGKLATDLRTTDPPEAPDPEIPDLVIPAAKPSKPTPVAETASLDKGSSFDDDMEFARGGDLQIDLTAAAKPGIARPPTPQGFSPFDDIATGPSLELDVQGGGLPAHVAAPSSSPLLARALPAPPPAPSHHTLSAEPPPLEVTADPFEAQALADFGPPPQAFWLAPMYAYRVMTRRSELRRGLTQTRDEADRTKKRVEDALVAFGEKARTLIKEGAALDRVKAAEDLLRSRDSALAGTMDAQRGALAEIDARLVSARAELASAKSSEAKASSFRDIADADAKRSEGKVKRIDIEARASGTAKQADRDAAVAEAAKATQKLAEAEAQLTETNRSTAAAQARVDVIEGERTAEEQRFSRQTGTRGAGVDDAHQQLRMALADLGRGMLADKTLTDLAAARDQVARLEEQAQAKAKSVAIHSSALTSYDAGKVYLGIALIVTAVVIATVVVLFPFIYRAVAT